MADSFVEFTVRGLETEDEADEITDELRSLDGVQMVEIETESGRAEVRYGEELLSEEDVKGTVRELGYDVE